MADTVRIIPLGGLGEIGKNMTAIEHRGKIVVVDCGVEFPRDEMLGIDLVLPDVSWLLERRADVLGFVITHGHEDHIGALPFVLRQLNVPVYASRFTLALIKSKLDEHGLLRTADVNEVSATSRFGLGPLHGLLRGREPQRPRRPVGRPRHESRRRDRHRRLQVRPHAHRRTHHRRQHVRAPRADGRAGAARRLHQRRDARLHALGGHSSARRSTRSSPRPRDA